MMGEVKPYFEKEIAFRNKEDVIEFFSSNTKEIKKKPFIVCFSNFNKVYAITISKTHIKDDRVGEVVYNCFKEKKIL